MCEFDYCVSACLLLAKVLSSVRLLYCSCYFGSLSEGSTVGEF